LVLIARHPFVKAKEVGSGHVTIKIQGGPFAAYWNQKRQKGVKATRR